MESTQQQQIEHEAQRKARLLEAAIGWLQFEKTPLEFSRKILRVPERSLWDGVQRMVNSVWANRKTAVQAGHAMSKDWTAGMLAVMWLCIYWGEARVVVTAPKMDQVKDIIFKEIARQYERLRQVFPSFRKDWLTTSKLQFSSNCFASGMTVAQTAEHINSKFSGFHSPNMLIIISEAQDIEPSIYRQITGLMTSPNSRLLELGNPVVEFGDFYDHCTDPNSGYNVIHLDVFQSPNIIAGREVIPGMASKEWLAQFQKDCGPDYMDHPEYQARALAMFPQQSAMAWIPLSKIKACIQKYRGLKSTSPDKIRVGGLDVAGAGVDETVFSVLEGVCMMVQHPFRKMMTPETIGWAKNLIMNENVESLAIDYGYDPGVTNMLAYDKMPVIKILFGEASPDEKYANFGTYIWGLLRAAIMREEVGILNDPVLVSQLSSRRIQTQPSGKLILESKKKSGQKSPDRGDALALAWYCRLLMISGGRENVVDSGMALDSHALHERIEAIHSSERSPETRSATKREEQADAPLDVNIGGVESEMDSAELFE